MAKKKNTNLLLPLGIATGLFFILRGKSTAVTGIGSVKSKYFNLSADTTIDDLKKQYYRLAKQYHPDTGGTNEAFKELNNEYEKLQAYILANGTFTSDEKINEEHLSEVYRDVINAIITIPGINIEIVGTWIWISGNTYPVKEQIKAAGFKFHRKKTMWFWYPGEWKKRSTGSMDMDDIRRKYGSEKIESKARYSLHGIESLAAKLIQLQNLLIKRENLISDAS
ncbi:MAG: J domain-containing protein [Epulopiscium sp.]|nr:J domain-containing protein [Candidatus Epulonipiscium sp.]